MRLSIVKMIANLLTSRFRRQTRNTLAGSYNWTGLRSTKRRGKFKKRNRQYQ